MKIFEIVYFFIEPFLITLRKEIRKRLLDLTKDLPCRPELLDVGGRRSHYTIGVPANITISDLPRRSAVQKDLDLGINDEIVSLIKRQRSNVVRVVYDDMTNSCFESSTFDCVVAVEVLEHVEEDFLFVQEVYRVLKAQGVFLMSVPNGEGSYEGGGTKRLVYGDHKRLYTKKQLEALLSRCFGDIHIEYAVKKSSWRPLGLRSWSLSHPCATIVSMFGNLMNSFESSRCIVKGMPMQTSHIIAVARKTTEAKGK